MDFVTSDEKKTHFRSIVNKKFFAIRPRVCVKKVNVVYFMLSFNNLKCKKPMRQRWEIRE